MQSYVIVGSGPAAVNAAKAIRDEDKKGIIQIFSAEPSLPYKRIKLSKALYSDLASEKVLIKKEKWYAKNEIQVHTSVKIEAINTTEQYVTTSEGDEVSYDKLLLCTGANNRPLPVDGVDLPGVFAIRDKQDAEDFKAYMENKTDVVVIGGGIQGLETAWSLQQEGKRVTIIELAPRLMARQLDEQTSQLVKEKVETAGVSVYVNTAIDRIVEENGEVAGVQVNGGEIITCESVIYSIGVIPNIQLLKGSSIKTNRGVVVNEQMQTNDPDIFAAGDVAELNSVVDGLWNTAMDEGKVAGQYMAGKQTNYEKATIMTIFNAFDTELFSIGNVDESQVDKTIKENREDGTYTTLFIKDQSIIGVISLEGVAQSMVYKSAIEQEVSLADIDVTTANVQEVMNAVKEKQNQQVVSI
ncbi:nitrite reductase (NADH) large subunit [Texcoconibacillus texcoconensis]|uniref:Nitrite reductase (NADH) large subunit n=2 Tax=Texcoconibacillus texcoconensis TaxID=1095777 RepID=A0A840QTP7_9BACI|nr:nitrite reductase (NADH) large subunit [Texcoconibacillus texcoconensis]